MRRSCLSLLGCFALRRDQGFTLDLTRSKPLDPPCVPLTLPLTHSYQYMSLDREKISSFYNPKHRRKVLMDLKGILNRKEYLTEDFRYWRL